MDMLERNALPGRTTTRRRHGAKAPSDMNAAGWRLHPLKGELAEHWAVWVDANWRLTFAFEGEDAVLIDYQDYH